MFSIYVKEHGEQDEVCEEIIHSEDWESAERTATQWVSERRRSNPAFEWAELRGDDGQGRQRTAHWGLEPR